MTSVAIESPSILFFVSGPENLSNSLSNLAIVCVPGLFFIHNPSLSVIDDTTVSHTLSRSTGYAVPLQDAARQVSDAGSCG